ncbi:MAG: YceI family protein [Flavobacterium sp.]
MKINIFVFLFLCCIVTQAQKIASTSKGSIQFEASVPLFEEIKAVNNNVFCSITFDTSEITCNLYVQEFKFKKALMQQHFTSYYLETDRYPKATFIGRIEKLEYTSLSKKPIKYEMKGIIKVHGKSKPLYCDVWIHKTNDGLTMTTTFILNTEDFNIEIPAIVASKISKQVTTSLQATLFEHQN